MLIIACLVCLVTGDEITLVDWREIHQEVAPVLDQCDTQDRIACQAQTRQNRLCNCDERCEQYGDCCLDYEKGDYRNTNIATRWMCGGVRIGGPFSGSKYYYMIGQCPTGYTDQNIIERCGKQVSRANYTYHLDMPVTSNSSGRTYVNIFCAICNNDHRNLYQHDVEITCDNHDLSVVLTF